MAGKKEGLAVAAPDAGAKLKGFAVAGADRKWVWADAVIEGDAVVVSAGDVKEPVAVRYGYRMNPEGANLYNRAGLPASPFRSDDW
jgi:sialate O-acetylesterase